MRLTSIRIKNYRTIEDLTVSFPSYYTAVCGRNDAGKSNILRLIRSAFQLPDRAFGFYEQPASVKEDFTKWKEKETPAQKRSIQIEVALWLDKNDDEGLYLFLKDYLPVPESLLLSPDGFEIKLQVTRIGEERTEQVALMLNDTTYEVLKSQEALNRLRSSGGFLFHDSTEFFHPYRWRQTAAILRDYSPSEFESMKAAKAKLDKVPFTITLGNEDGEVELENRTRILMTLFSAKQVRTSGTSAAKITPIIFIEEPESYLHPSAQAEFGATLRELANEFKVQVIVTTHSPYLMSLSEPNSNILLERKSVGRKLRQTEVVNTTGERWMEPFGLALGISGDEIAPWKEVLFSQKDCAILVEGETDRDYLEALRSEDHGANKLDFDGVIFPYNGKDALRQSQLISFIRSRFKKCIITYDLDVETDIEPSLKRINLAKGTDYFPIGPANGRRNIEGLLPSTIFQSVYAEHPEVVQLLETGSSTESKNARCKLKAFYLEKFLKTVKAGDPGWDGLYSLSKKFNKLLNK